MEIKIFGLNISKWVRGWRMDKFIAKLLGTKELPRNESGEILLTAGVEKTINAITQVQVFWNTIGEPLWDAITSDEAEASAEEVEKIVEEVKVTLQSVDTTSDISLALKDYVFSPNEAFNKFLHEIVGTILVMFSDGELSEGELIMILSRIATYAKEGE